MGSENKKDFISILNEKTSIDTDLGLSLNLNDLDLYKIILKEIVRGESMEAFSGSFLRNDFENYRIYVHNIKGLLKTIGENTLAKEAELLELSLKNGDEYYVKSHHEMFLIKLKDLWNAIEEALSYEEDISG